MGVSLSFPNHCTALGIVKVSVATVSKMMSAWSTQSRVRLASSERTRSSCPVGRRDTNAEADEHEPGDRNFWGGKKRKYQVA